MDRITLGKKLLDLDRITWRLPLLNDDEWSEIYFKIDYEIKHAQENDFDDLSKKMDIIKIGIEYKYGYTNKLFKSIPQMSHLSKIMDNLDLNRDLNYLEKEISVIKESMTKFVNSLDNYDFLTNPYTNTMNFEGLKLSLDSIKTIIENPSYQKEFPSKEKLDFLVDYIKLADNKKNFAGLVKQYSEPIDNIWKNELTNSPNENGGFKMLVSMINSENDSLSIENQVQRLLDRPYQHSCSIISNNFIGTYRNEYTRIGFIYPSDSKIITCGDEDIRSFVFQSGTRDTDKSTKIATPQALLHNCAERAISKGQDLLNSDVYNEVLVDSSAKPCGIVVLASRDQELQNRNFYLAKMLADQLELPLTVVNTMVNQKEIQETGVAR